MMGAEAIGAIFDPAFCIVKISAASVCQTVQRTVAEYTAECFRVGSRMTWEIFTCFVLEKIIVMHFYSSN